MFFYLKKICLFVLDAVLISMSCFIFYFTVFFLYSPLLCLHSGCMCLFILLYIIFLSHACMHIYISLLSLFEYISLFMYIYLFLLMHLLFIVLLTEMFTVYILCLFACMHACICFASGRSA